MGIRKRVAFAAALAIFAAAALGATTDRSAAEPAREGAATKAGRLVAFGSCPDLLRYSKAQATRFVGPYGLGGRPGIVNDAAARAREASPPKQGVDFSGTNVQEEGVDEPDMVKTDGNTLYALANGKLNAVDVSGAKPRLLDTLSLDPGRSHELLLHGNRLLVLSRGGYWAEPMPAMASRMMPYAPAQSALAEIDVSNPKALRLVRTLTLDGAYVAARLVGGSVRIVATSQVPEHAAVRAAHERHRRRSSPRRASATAPLSPRPASGAGCRRTGSSARAQAREEDAARPVPPRAQAVGVLGPRHADRADDRPREGARARRLGRRDDRRADRLRVAGEPLRRDRALGRPARPRRARRR